jgi:hypothetical protein
MRRLMLKMSDQQRADRVRGCPGSGSIENRRGAATGSIGVNLHQIMQADVTVLAAINPVSRYRTTPPRAGTWSPAGFWRAVMVRRVAGCKLMRPDSGGQCAMAYKFRIAETVTVMQARSSNVPRDVFEVVRQLPGTQGEPEYQIKSIAASMNRISASRGKAS